MLAIMAGLVIGKPLGRVAVSALATRLGVAVKRDEYFWRQLAGARSWHRLHDVAVYCRGQAFPAASDLAAEKIAVFAASVLSPIVGVAPLPDWRSSGRPWRRPRRAPNAPKNGM